MVNISTAKPLSPSPPSGGGGAKPNKLGFQVRLCFQLTQHSRDELLMKSLVEFFNCGGTYSRSRGKDAIDYSLPLPLGRGRG